MNIHNVANFLRLLQESSSDDWDNISAERMQKAREQAGEDVSTEDNFRHISSPKRYDPKEELVINSREDIEKFLFYFVNSRKSVDAKRPLEGITDIFIKDHDAPLVWEIFQSLSEENPSKAVKAKKSLFRNAFSTYQNLQSNNLYRTLENIQYLFSLLNVLAVIASPSEIRIFKKTPIYAGNIGKPLQHFFDGSIANSRNIKKFGIIQMKTSPVLEKIVSSLCNEVLTYEELEEIIDSLHTYIVSVVNSSKSEYADFKASHKKDFAGEKDKDEPEYEYKDYVDDVIINRSLSPVVINAIINRSDIFNAERGVADASIVITRRSNIINNIKSFFNGLFAELSKDLQIRVREKESAIIEDIYPILDSVYGDEVVKEFIQVAYKMAMSVLSTDEDISFFLSYRDFIDDLRFKKSVKINLASGEAQLIPIKPLLDIMESLKESAALYYGEDMFIEKINPTKIDIENKFGVKTLYQKYDKLANFYKKLNMEITDDGEIIEAKILEKETIDELTKACSAYLFDFNQKVFENSKKNIAKDVVSTIKKYLDPKDLIIKDKGSLLSDGQSPLSLDENIWENILFISPYNAFESNENLINFAMKKSSDVIKEIKQSSGAADVSIKSIRNNSYIQKGKSTGEDLMVFPKTSEPSKKGSKDSKKDSEDLEKAKEMKKYLDFAIDSLTSDEKEQNKQFLIDSFEGILLDIGYKLIHKTGIECFKVILSTHIKPELIKEIDGFNILFSYLLYENKYYMSRYSSVNKAGSKDTANMDLQEFFRLHKSFKDSIIKNLRKETKDRNSALALAQDYIQSAEQNLLHDIMIKILPNLKLSEEQEEQETQKDKSDKKGKPGKKKKSLSQRANEKFQKVKTSLRSPVPQKEDWIAKRILRLDSQEFERYLLLDKENKVLLSDLGEIDNNAFLVLYMNKKMANELLKESETSDVSGKLQAIYEELFSTIMAQETFSRPLHSSGGLFSDKVEKVREILGYSPLKQKISKGIEAAADFYIKNSEFYDAKGEQIENRRLSKIRSTRIKLENHLLQYEKTFESVVKSFEKQVAAKKGLGSLAKRYANFIQRAGYQTSQKLLKFSKDAAIIGESEARLTCIENFRRESLQFFDNNRIIEMNGRAMDMIGTQANNRDELAAAKKSFLYRTRALWEDGASSMENKYKEAFVEYDKVREEEEEDEFEGEELSADLKFSKEDFEQADKVEQPMVATQTLDTKKDLSTTGIDDLNDFEDLEDTEEEYTSSKNKTNPNLPPKPKLLKPDDTSQEPIKEGFEPKIKIKFKKKANKFYEIINNTPDDFSQLVSIMDEFIPYSKEYLGYDKPVKVVLDYPQDYRDPFAPTGQYDPRTSTIVVFVQGRHPKDILRSLSHELSHHHQNCRGMFAPNLMGDGAVEGYAQTNSHLRKMEKEATNLMLRDFEDKRRKKNGR